MNLLDILIILCVFLSIIRIFIYMNDTHINNKHKLRLVLNIESECLFKKDFI